MVLKEVISVNVSSVPVVSFDATSDFTTDAIPWDDLRGFSVNFWFPILNGVSPKPRITIQVSDTDDLGSFVTYVDADNIAIPQLFEKNSIKPNYIRFVYDSTDVGASSTITINFYRITL